VNVLAATLLALLAALPVDRAGQGAALDDSCIMIIMLRKATCDLISPSFRRRSDAIFAAWKRKNAGAVERLRSTQRYRDALEGARATVARGQTDGEQQIFTDAFIEELQAEVRPVVQNSGRVAANGKLVWYRAICFDKGSSWLDRRHRGADSCDGNRNSAAPHFSRIDERRMEARGVEAAAPRGRAAVAMSGSARRIAAAAKNAVPATMTKKAEG